LPTRGIDNSESRIKARPKLSQSDWVYHQNGAVISAGIFDINIKAIGSHVASASFGHLIVCTRPKISTANGVESMTALPRSGAPTEWIENQQNTHSKDHTPGCEEKKESKIKIVRAC